MKCIGILKPCCIHILRFHQHIRTRFAVKRKFPVAIFLQCHECQRSIRFIGSADIVASDAAVLKLFHDLITKWIIPQLSDHGCLTAKLYIGTADIRRSAPYLWFKGADIL